MKYKALSTKINGAISRIKWVAPSALDSASMAHKMDQWFSNLLNLEGLYISLGGYTRHPFDDDIHQTILLAGLQHCFTESLASFHIISIIVGNTFLSLLP
jgi:hypothetical protein